MILNRLYTIPRPLFFVEFKDGINFIFGKKDNPNAPKESLNGIGKSTFLDFLDFALLASFQKNHSPRLYAAYKKGLLDGISIVLDFEIDKINYTIKRSFDEAKVVDFYKEDILNEQILCEDFKKVLSDLIFLKGSYKGFYSSNWLRRLLPFYLKIQKPKKEKFIDPVQYIREINATELNQYILFLMDIDNTLSHENLYIQTQLKKIENTLDNVEEFINQSYDLQDVSEAISRIQYLKIEIEELNKTIEKFNLTKQYKVDEEKANRLTSQIKELWFQNHSDRKKIDAYKESVQIDLNINTNKIELIFNDLNYLLAQNIKKSLDDAITFRKQLVASRKEFIENEVNQLKAVIADREKIIQKAEAERKRIFEFLAAEEAIKDLTEAFKIQSEKSKELADIESQIKLYQDLNREKNLLEQDEKKLEGKILEFVLETQVQGLNFTRTFKKVYDAIYPELSDPSIINISSNFNAKSKIQLNILPNTEMLSKGRNQGRTLVFDLSVLFNSIEKGINAPRFLVHDGIFDGMDKAHFIALYEFLEEQKLEGKRFQYIITYNEEGTLTENFGKADKVTTDKIEQEAILILSPQNKLLGKF